jgi:DNA-binding transcriptional ArsR family regulator
MSNRPEILRLLSDGQWRTADEIASAVAKLYPPERALRHIRCRRKYDRARSKGSKPWQIVQIDLDEEIFLGQQMCAKADVTCLKKDGFLEGEKQGERVHYALSRKGEASLQRRLAEQPAT